MLVLHEGWKNALQKELNDRNKNISIKVDKKFVCSRQALTTQRKQPAQLAKGNKLMYKTVNWERHWSILKF